MNAPRLPDARFFEIADDGPVLLRVSYSRMGGLKEWALCQTIGELAAYVAKLPSAARVEILSVHSVFGGEHGGFDDCVYVANELGELEKGSY